MSEYVKNTVDGLSVVTVLGSLTTYLPDIAAVLAIIWTGIRIYEWARIRLLNKPPTDGVS